MRKHAGTFELKMLVQMNPEMLVGQPDHLDLTLFVTVLEIVFVFSDV